MKRRILLLFALLLLTVSAVACAAAETPAVEEPVEEVVEEEPIEEEVVEEEPIEEEVVEEEPVEEEVVEEEPVEEEVVEEEPVEEEVVEEEPVEEEVVEEEPLEEEPLEEGALGTEEAPIVMSFVPSGETDEIVASGEQLAEAIQERTGLVVESNVATSFAAVVEAMCAGQAEVGWLNTFSYVLASERDCADVALATIRFGIPYYTGQIVANADAGIETIEDITPEHTVCWVDPLSTSGYIIPRIELAAVGVDPDALESQIVGSHPNVINAVYEGQCDVGATYVDARTAVADELPDVNDRVIVVHESAEIPNDTVSFTPDVPEETQEAITSALLDIAQTEEGAAWLLALYEIEGFEEVDDSFYDEFRTQLDASGINIEELVEE